MVESFRVGIYFFLSIGALQWNFPCKCFFLLFNAVATRPMWFWSAWNVTNVTETVNFKICLILENVNMKSHTRLGSTFLASSVLCGSSTSPMSGVGTDTLVQGKSGWRLNPYLSTSVLCLALPILWGITAGQRRFIVGDDRAADTLLSPLLLVTRATTDGYWELPQACAPCCRHTIFLFILRNDSMRCSLILDFPL